MSYSITPVLHTHKDKNDLHKIMIRVIFKRNKIYIPTTIRVKKNQFHAKEVINHINADKINSLIRKKITDAESMMLDALRQGEIINLRDVFQQETQKKETILFSNYITDLADRLKGKLSEGTLKHYRSIAGKIDQWFGNTKLEDVNTAWLETFEAKLREPKKIKGIDVVMDNNTINANMKRLKSILNKATASGLIDEGQYRRYKVPLYKQKLVEYLSEKELEKLSDLVSKINKPGHKIAGYYFLLSCYTGWRISDVMRFKYEQMVNNGKVILRAKKNGQIVSMPVHSRLKKVLSQIRDLPFELSEQKARQYVKDLCSLAGISKDVSFHTGRHSFAMLLMANGFTIDEAAELLGDSAMIAKVYARIHNDSLDKKIREKLG